MGWGEVRNGKERKSTDKKDMSWKKGESATAWCDKNVGLVESQ